MFLYPFAIVISLGITAKSEPLPSRSQDSTPKPLPEPQTPMEGESQYSDLHFSFEEDFFEDFGNISDYSYQNRLSVPITPSNALEDEFLTETVQELTTIMSNEWLREVEL